MEIAVFEFSLQQQWAQGKNEATQGKTEGKIVFTSQALRLTCNTGLCTYSKGRGEKL